MLYFSGYNISTLYMLSFVNILQEVIMTKGRYFIFFLVFRVYILFKKFFFVFTSYRLQVLFF